MSGALMTGTRLEHPYSLNQYIIIYRSSAARTQEILNVMRTDTSKCFVTVQNGFLMEESDETFRGVHAKNAKILTSVILTKKVVCSL